MPKVFTLILVAAFAGPALAQTEAEMAEYKRNCTGDYMRLCSAYQPSSPQVQECFRANMRNLSPRCQATIQKAAKGGRR